TGRAGEAPRGGAGWRVPTWSAAQRGPSGGGAGRRLALSPFRYARSRTRSPPASQVQQRRPGKDDPRRPMTRFVITPDAALHAAQHRIAIPPEHQLLAPTLFRSQALSALYRAVRSGELSRAEAEERLVYVRSLPMRLLGDRV